MVHYGSGGFDDIEFVCACGDGIQDAGEDRFERLPFVPLIVMVAKVVAVYAEGDPTSRAASIRQFCSPSRRLSKLNQMAARTSGRCCK